MGDGKGDIKKIRKRPFGTKEQLKNEIGIFDLLPTAKGTRNSVSIKLRKSRGRSGFELVTGPQDGEHRQIHWSMAA